MSDNSTEAPYLESEGASTYAPKTYDIAPEDAALAESLVNLDPIRDLTGPVTVVGAVKMPTQITRETLPPAVLSQVDARLGEMPEQKRTPQAEQAIILQEAENYAYAVRVWGGPGEDANAYQQERFLVESDIFEVQRKLSERLGALAEIVRHDRVSDEATGEVHDEPVYRLQGDGRTAAQHEVSELKQRLALLKGSEGSQRLAKAKWQAVQDYKKLQEEAAIDREAQTQAKSDVRAARVAERAAAYRKFEDTER